MKESLLSPKKTFNSLFASSLLLPFLSKTITYSWRQITEDQQYVKKKNGCSAIDTKIIKFNKRRQLQIRNDIQSCHLQDTKRNRKEEKINGEVNNLHIQGKFNKFKLNPVYLHGKNDRCKRVNVGGSLQPTQHKQNG